METVTNVKVIRRGVIGFKGQCRFKPSTVVGGKGGALMAPEQCPVHQLSGTSAPVLVARLRLVGLGLSEAFQSCRVRYKHCVSVVPFRIFHLHMNYSFTFYASERAIDRTMRAMTWVCTDFRDLTQFLFLVTRAFTSRISGVVRPKPKRCVSRNIKIAGYPLDAVRSRNHILYESRCRIQVSFFYFHYFDFRIVCLPLSTEATRRRHEMRHLMRSGEYTRHCFGPAA